MAHFAQLDANNIVTQVIVVHNDVIENLPFPESEPIGVAFCHSLYGSDTVWKQTSYNANFRGVYATIGNPYDPVTDAFIVPPRPDQAELDELYARSGPLPPPSTETP